MGVVVIVVMLFWLLFVLVGLVCYVNLLYGFVVACSCLVFVCWFKVYSV